MACEPRYLWIRRICVWPHILDGAWQITLLKRELTRQGPAETAQKLIFKRAALCNWLQRTMRSKRSAVK